jgi:hypothetical protein
LHSQYRILLASLNAFRVTRLVFTAIKWLQRGKGSEARQVGLHHPASAMAGDAGGIATAGIDAPAVDQALGGTDELPKISDPMDRLFPQTRRWLWWTTVATPARAGGTRQHAPPRDPAAKRQLAHAALERALSQQRCFMG